MTNRKMITGNEVDQKLVDTMLRGLIAPAESRWFVEVEVKNASWLDTGAQGVFARQDINRNQVVCIAGGRIMQDLSAVPSEMSYATIIGDGLFLAPASYGNPSPDWLLNHHCENNLSTFGSIVMIANRNISCGKELTVNYTTLIASVDRFRMECACNSKKCRKEITGNDWQNRTLAKKFFAEWPPFVQRWVIERGILS